MDQRRRQLLAAVGSSVALPLAGCGALLDASTETDAPESDDDADSPTEATTSSTPTATLTPESATATVTPTPTPEGTTSGPDTTTQTTTEQAETQSTPSRIAAQDGDSEDQFGVGELSADGTTAVIGAPFDEDPQGADTGSAYVFERGTDGWTQQTKLSMDRSWAPALFGLSAGISADGSSVVVGAPLRSSRETVGGGGAYVFDRSADTWELRASIRPEGVQGGDFFGAVVRMADDGDTVLIGTPKARTSSGDGSGSASVFTRDGGEWERQTELTAHDGDPRDEFGASMALSATGDHAVVGAPYDDDPNGNQGGSMSVFEREDGSWSRRAKLALDDGESGDEFPTALAVSRDGGTVLASCMNDDPNGTDSGSVAVFSGANPSKRWTQTALLTPDDRDAGDAFGTDVALSADGTRALVGAFHEENPHGDPAGAAYTFALTDGEWVQQAKLAPAAIDESDRFGIHTSMAGEGTPMLVGATYDDDPNGTNAGSAYLFE